MRIWLGAALAVLLLTACNKAELSQREAAIEARPDAAQDAADPAPTKAAPVTLPSLAYRHDAVMEARAEALRPMMNRHEAACVAAGPAVCQVTGSEAREDRGEFTAKLSLRAAPAWLARFRTGLEDEARGAGGKLAGSATETEDLTRQLIDTEAHLRAKEALRARLERLVATRGSKLSELLELEAQLTRVQAEIDAARSSFAHMQGRVRMSEMTLTYRSPPVAIGARTLEPLEKAVTSAAGLAAGGLAALITIGAAISPFALAGGVVALVVFRRRRARRAAEPSASA